MIKKIPDYIIKVLEKIEKTGFEAYIVGGCVRDLLMDKKPNDWDITTSAKPEEILGIFPDGKYENQFGTVIIPEKYLGQEESVDNIEITTYRIESTYSDRRRPDEVKFAKTLGEDLGRRDFTVNAMALGVKNKLIDLFDGEKDLNNRLIRAVGNPEERFNEDALRMMRAVRFAAQLSKGDDLTFLKEREGEGHQNEKVKSNNLWRIGDRTFVAIQKHENLLRHISPERIRDELEKIILSNRPAWGVELLVETNLMKNIIPEIYSTIGIKQNRHHYHGPYNTVYKHMLAALKTCPSKKLEVRLAAWMHDIGKPESKRGEGEFSTFHGHEYISARMTEKILEKLKFPRKTINKTVLLVKNHMFYYNVDEVGEHGVRRVVRKVGLENINDLIDVRIGDRLGSGVTKAVPYKLRHFKYMVEKVSTDPISVKQLKVSGNDLIKELKIKPGPKIGAILEVLLAEVINDPELNKKETLLKYADELQNKDLKKLDKLAKNKIESKQQEEDKEIKVKYWIK
jgi:tRNA nucleotidyltransferase (CCA-adding enzyme)